MANAVTAGTCNPLLLMTEPPWQRSASDVVIAPTPPFKKSCFSTNVLVSTELTSLEVAL